MEDSSIPQTPDASARFFLLLFSLHLTDTQHLPLEQTVDCFPSHAPNRRAAVEPSMIRALRAPALGRQSLATRTTTTTTTTTTSPLQRLAAQAWRSTAGKTTPASTRSIHAAAGRGAAGRTTWRTTGTTSTKAAQDTLARAQRRNFNWSWARRSKAGKGAKAEESLSLSARLRKLSREYGWAAAGVYLGLSVLDFPFCFLLVKWAGTDRIGTSVFTPLGREDEGRGSRERTDVLLAYCAPPLPLLRAWFGLGWAGP